MKETTINQTVPFLMVTLDSFCSVGPLPSTGTYNECVYVCCVFSGTSQLKCTPDPSTSASLCKRVREKAGYSLKAPSLGSQMDYRFFCKKFEKHYCPQSKLNVFPYNGSGFEPRRLNWPCFLNLKCSAQRPFS